MLMEHETQKIKELDEQYSNELREWKAMLVPRKQVNTQIYTRFKHEIEWLWVPSSPKALHCLYPLLGTGSTQEDPSRHD